MGILAVLLLVQVLYVHETGVVLYVWVAGCAVASVAGVAGAVRLRRLATARPVPPTRPAPTPAAAVAAVVEAPEVEGRHAPAPGRWSAALVNRLDQPTVAHDMTVEDLAAAAARAGAR